VVELVEQVLGMLAIWLVWTLAGYLIIVPTWVWYLGALAAGIAWELLVEPSTWWLGIGVAGGAAVLMLVTDLIMVATDSAKVTVLRHRR
jgi:hypothetical protein